MKRTRRLDAGFTLIEILISLVLLMVGIVGILSLFPVAIKNVNDSVEDSAASNLAQSLYGAMTEAMRRPVLGEVWLTHDGLPGGNFKFKLPTTVSTPDVYPVPGTGTDSTLEVYQLGTDGRSLAQVTDIRTPIAWSMGGDPTEPTRQYSFQFEVSKPLESVIVVDTAGTTTNLPLYQYRFIIYRSYFKPAGGVPAGTLHPAQVKEFTTFIAGTGL